MNQRDILSFRGFVNEHLSDDNEEQNTVEPVIDTDIYTEANLNENTEQLVTDELYENTEQLVTGENFRDEVYNTEELSTQDHYVIDGHPTAEKLSTEELFTDEFYNSPEIQNEENVPEKLSTGEDLIPDELYNTPEFQNEENVTVADREEEGGSLPVYRLDREEEGEELTRSLPLSHYFKSGELIKSSSKKRNSKRKVPWFPLFNDKEFDGDEPMKDGGVQEQQLEESPMDISRDESGVEEQRPKEQSGERLNREDSFLKNFNKNCEVRGEVVEEEHKGLYGDHDLSPEPVDDDGLDDEFIKDDSLYDLYLASYAKGGRQHNKHGPDRDQELSSELGPDGDKDNLEENQLEVSQVYKTAVSNFFIPTLVLLPNP